jgi:hypothetical protein
VDALTSLVLNLDTTLSYFKPPRTAFASILVKLGVIELAGFRALALEPVQCVHRVNDLVVLTNMSADDGMQYTATTSGINTCAHT